MADNVAAIDNWVAARMKATGLTKKAVERSTELQAYKATLATAAAEGGPVAAAEGGPVAAASLVDLEKEATDTKTKADKGRGKRGVGPQKVLNNAAAAARALYDAALSAAAAAASSGSSAAAAPLRRAANRSVVGSLHVPPQPPLLRQRMGAAAPPPPRGLNSSSAAVEGAAASGEGTVSPDPVLHLAAAVKVAEANVVRAKQKGYRAAHMVELETTAAAARAAAAQASAAAAKPSAAAVPQGEIAALGPTPPSSPRASGERGRPLTKDQERAAKAIAKSKSASRRPSSVTRAEFGRARALLHGACADAWHDFGGVDGQPAFNTTNNEKEGRGLLDVKRGLPTDKTAKGQVDLTQVKDPPFDVKAKDDPDKLHGEGELLQELFSNLTIEDIPVSQSKDIMIEIVIAMKLRTQAFYKKAGAGAGLANIDTDFDYDIPTVLKNVGEKNPYKIKILHHGDECNIEVMKEQIPVKTYIDFFDGNNIVNILIDAYFVNILDLIRCAPPSTVPIYINNIVTREVVNDPASKVYYDNSSKRSIDQSIAKNIHAGWYSDAEEGTITYNAWPTNFKNTPDGDWKNMSHLAREMFFSKYNIQLGPLVPAYAKDGRSAALPTATLEISSPNKRQIWTSSDPNTTNNIPNCFSRIFAKTTANKKENDENVAAAYQCKRSGDWLQALSCLDKKRKFEDENLNKVLIRGTNIILLTHDRVLLYYGLLLGLDVLFTTMGGKDKEAAAKAAAERAASPASSKGKSAAERTPKFVLYFSNQTTKGSGPGQQASFASAAAKAAAQRVTALKKAHAIAEAKKKTFTKTIEYLAQADTLRAQAAGYEARLTGLKTEIESEIQTSIESLISKVDTPIEADKNILEIMRSFIKLTSLASKPIVMTDFDKCETVAKAVTPEIAQAATASADAAARALEEATTVANAAADAKTPEAAAAIVEAAEGKIKGLEAAAAPNAVAEQARASAIAAAEKALAEARLNKRRREILEQGEPPVEEARQAFADAQEKVNEIDRKVQEKRNEKGKKGQQYVTELKALEEQAFDLMDIFEPAEKHLHEVERLHAEYTAVRLGPAPPATHETGPAIIEAERRLTDLLGALDEKVGSTKADILEGPQAVPLTEEQLLSVAENFNSIYDSIDSSLRIHNTEASIRTENSAYLKENVYTNIFRFLSEQRSLRARANEKTPGVLCLELVSFLSSRLNETYKKKLFLILKDIKVLFQIDAPTILFNIFYENFSGILPLKPEDKEEITEPKEHILSVMGGPAAEPDDILPRPPLPTPAERNDKVAREKIRDNAASAAEALPDGEEKNFAKNVAAEEAKAAAKAAAKANAEEANAEEANAEEANAEEANAEEANAEEATALPLETLCAIIQQDEQFKMALYEMPAVLEQKKMAAQKAAEDAVAEVDYQNDEGWQHSAELVRLEFIQTSGVAAAKEASEAGQDAATAKAAAEEATRALIESNIAEDQGEAVKAAEAAAARALLAMKAKKTGKIYGDEEYESAEHPLAEVNRLRNKVRDISQIEAHMAFENADKPLTKDALEILQEAARHNYVYRENLVKALTDYADEISGIIDAYKKEGINTTYEESILNNLNYEIELFKCINRRDATYFMYLLYLETNINNFDEDYMRGLTTTGIFVPPLNMDEGALDFEEQAYTLVKDSPPLRTLYDRLRFGGVLDWEDAPAPGAKGLAGAEILSVMRAAPVARPLPTPHLDMLSMLVSKMPPPKGGALRPKAARDEAVPPTSKSLEDAVEVLKTMTIKSPPEAPATKSAGIWSSIDHTVKLRTRTERTVLVGGGGGAAAPGRRGGGQRGGGRQLDAVSKLSYFTYCREMISTLNGFSSDYKDTCAQYNKFVALALACIDSLDSTKPTFYNEAEALLYDMLGSGDLSELKAGNRIFLHDEEDLFYLARIGNLIAMKSIYQAGGPIASLGNTCTLGVKAVDDYYTIVESIETMDFYASRKFLIDRIHERMGLTISLPEKLVNNSPVVEQRIVAPPVHFNLSQITKQKPKTRKRLNQNIRNYLADQNAILASYQTQKRSTLKGQRNALRAMNPPVKASVKQEQRRQVYIPMVAAHSGGRRTRKMKHTKRTKSRRH